eukprot:TRINITY_DN28838_c0_g1_i1.p1 TRINITY_DN28838_c0_g1~~TRINITY_DN28838_c0_g1_i1.p1  ORF type:complete len:678 (-),score=150.83 TRINITY_DN28838_c0_g1_i1:40-2073(-)
MYTMAHGEVACFFPGAGEDMCGEQSCGAHGVCVNLAQYQGSFTHGDTFRCSCRDGFRDNGTTCVPVRCPELTDKLGTWSGSTIAGAEYTLKCDDEAYVTGGSEKATTISCSEDGRWSTVPYCLSPTQEAQDAAFETARFRLNVGASLACVACAALACGLTLGLVGLDAREMDVIRMAQVEDCTSPKEAMRLRESQRAAAAVALVLKDHHLLLVTLLLLNAAANEALPLFLDEIVSPFCAVLLSVTFVLICGEILPSAFFTGPRQLTIASWFVPCVRVLLSVMYCVAKPIAILLEKGFGHEESTSYSRAELRAVLRLHGRADASSSGRSASAGSLGARALELSPRGDAAAIALADGYGLLDMTPATEHPLRSFEAELCEAAMDLGATRVVDCIGILRTLSRLATDFLAVGADDDAFIARERALRAGAEALVVFESLDDVHWPSVVPPDSILDVLPLDRLLCAPQGRSTLRAHVSQRAAHESADEGAPSAPLPRGMALRELCRPFGSFPCVGLQDSVSDALDSMALRGYPLGYAVVRHPYGDLAGLFNGDDAFGLLLRPLAPDSAPSTPADSPGAADAHVVTVKAAARGSPSGSAGSSAAATTAKTSRSRDRRSQRSRPRSAATSVETQVREDLDHYTQLRERQAIGPADEDERWAALAVQSFSDEEGCGVSLLRRDEP